MRPIRFCMLTTFYPPFNFGGDGIQVQRLAHALADAGHEVTVAHSREGYRALAQSPRPPFGGHPRVRVVPIDAGLGPVSPFATYLSGRPLLVRRRLEALLDEGFDVIHFHNPSLLGGPGLLAMGEAIKLYTAHESWLLCPAHVLWKRSGRICQDPPCWSCELSHGRPPQPWRRTGLIERSLEQLDALIAPSRSSMRLHSRFAPIVRLEQLGHFVTSAAEHTPRSTRAGLVPERPFFLFAGRLESIKGVDLLIEAFRRRSEDLVIAGTGPRERSLRRAAAGLEHVRFTGWLPAADLDVLYREALAVIVPTLGHEAFGLVAVEAFARGTPAVVHGTGALAELVEESGGGIAYETQEGLEQALDRLASDAELRRRLGERGHSAYLARWTPEAHLRRYLALVAQLARERGDDGLAAAASRAEAASPSGTAVQR